MAFDSRLLGGIRVMAAIVEGGSFVSAAETLGLTPSGVSRALARLEERVGVRLFDRSSRAVMLTDEGRQFHEQVAPLLAGIEEAAARAARSSTDVQGRLRVNVDPTFARLVLAPRVDRFLATHPGLSLELAIRDGLGDLVADGFDAAVRFGEPEPSALVARLLLRTRVLTCAAPSYLGRHGRPARPRDLGERGHECILFRDPRTGRPFAWEFHRGRKVVDVAVTGRLVVNDYATLLAACTAGHGIAQVMEVGTSDLIASGDLVVLFPDWSDELLPLYAFHASRHLPAAKVRAFLDFVVSSTR